MQLKTTELLMQKANEIRARVIQMSHDAGSPHLGSALSCADIVIALYFRILSIDPQNPKDENRDRLLFSKGHAASVLYATLAYRGFFPREDLCTFAQNGSVLAEHPPPTGVPGVEIASGSLGHGLPIGLGMALAAKRNKKNYRIFVLMSDGECNEGSVWEAAMFGASQKLDNVIAIIDFNKWQATGRSQEIMKLDPLKEKWEAFGWSAYEVNGHNFEELLRVLEKVPDGTGKPVAIVAHTVKGKGVSFMEDDNNWHYRIPNAEEVKKSFAELGQQ